MVNLVTLGMFGGAGIGSGQIVQQVVQTGWSGGGFTPAQPVIHLVKIEDNDQDINIIVTDIIDMSTIW